MREAELRGAVGRSVAVGCRQSSFYFWLAGLAGLAGMHATKGPQKLQRKRIKNVDLPRFHFRFGEREREREAMPKTSEIALLVCRLPNGSD